jgi:hypothetical protein
MLFFVFFPIQSFPIYLVTFAGCQRLGGRWAVRMRKLGLWLFLTTLAVLIWPVYLPAPGFLEFIWFLVMGLSTFGISPASLGLGLLLGGATPSSSTQSTARSGRWRSACPPAPS